MTRAASTDGHNESYERSSCLPRPSGRPGVTPSYSLADMCSMHFDRPTGQQQLAQPGFSQAALPPAASKLPASGPQWVPTCQSLARQDLDFQVEAWASDVMAGAGGAAGPAPYVRHQPPGDVNGPGESRAC